MLKVKYKHTWSSAHQHPYRDEIIQTQDRLFSALIVGLLDRFVQNEEEDLSRLLNAIFHDNAVWNHIKEIQGFKRNEQDIIKPLIDSSRNIVIFKKLIYALSENAGPLLKCTLVNQILEQIPRNLSAEILEEFLEKFMEEEQYRRSPVDGDLFIAAMNKAESIAEAPNLGNRNEREYSLEELEEDIKLVQAQSQKQFSYLSASDSNKQEEGGATVRFELSKSIHQILVVLHQTYIKENLLTDYITSLEASTELITYANRPVYKLALRVRNILILSNIKENVTFSKKAVSKVIKHLAKLLIEALEIGLVANLATTIKTQEILNEYVENTIYPLLCMIQNKIKKNPISAEIPETLQNAASEHEQALESLRQMVIADCNAYEEISQKDFLVNNSEAIYTQVATALKSEINLDQLKTLLSDIFLKVAEQIASSSFDTINLKTFNTTFFGDNSSNPLLEFSRIFLFNFSALEKENLTSSINKVLDKESNFISVYTYLEAKFSCNHTWTVYLPIVGIKVNDDFPESWTLELIPSVSEIYNVKFLTSKILDSISLECTSSLLNEPVLIRSQNADACAVIADIKAGDGFQAATIAVNILLDTIESQFCLMKFGQQYRIKPLQRDNTEIICFCKKIINTSSDYSWSLSCLPIPGWRPICRFELTKQNKKHLTLPSTLLKILSKRSERDDLLGVLACDLMHCIKLYRQGYFAERLSERFRLYWTVLDTLLSPENFSGTEKHSIPYRVSLFCLGVTNLIAPGDTYTYKQARMWMREDIEDLYAILRNPLIHRGIEYVPAYDRLLERVEDIVSFVLKQLTLRVIYMNLPDAFLRNGLNGIISFLEAQSPGTSQIFENLSSTEVTENK